MSRRHLPLRKMDLVRHLPPIPATLPLPHPLHLAPPPHRSAGRGEAPGGGEEAANLNTRLASQDPAGPAGSSFLGPGRKPGPRAGITSASTEAAAGKGQCVQLVVSGTVSQSGPQEPGGHLGTGRVPLLKRSCLSWVLRAFQGDVHCSCTPHCLP